MRSFIAPQQTEYPPYFEPYISKVKDEDILSFLQLQAKELLSIVENTDDIFLDDSYETGKWTMKELVIHLIDTERIFCTRALQIARGEAKSLPGYEQDDYVREADAARRTKESLLEEYIANRISTLAFFKGLSKQTHGKVGIANELNVSVRSLLYAIAGHEKHHLEVLKNKYL
jgi:uncharacterized damage-inducible protein DinB